MKIVYYYHHSLGQFPIIENLVKEFQLKSFEACLITDKPTERQLAKLEENEIKALPCLEIMQDKQSKKLYGIQDIEEIRFEIEEYLYHHGKN